MTDSKKNAEIIGAAMTPSRKPTPKVTEVMQAMNSDQALAQFQKVLGDKTPLFIQTVANLIGSPTSAALQKCSTNSIVRSCMACAVTGLTIDPAFGMAAIVPFGDKATFMPMKNGLVQLANNTGLIQRLNAAPVYEGDIAAFNPFTGDYTYNTDPHKREVLIGYIAYLRFINGADHYLYMTVEELQAHGRRYSKSYNKQDGLWNTNFPVMAEKTVLKQLISKWCSIDTMANSKLWLALKFDQATPTSLDLDAAQAIYPDSTSDQSAVEDAEAKEV